MRSISTWSNFLCTLVHADFVLVLCRINHTLSWETSIYEAALHRCGHCRPHLFVALSPAPAKASEIIDIVQGKPQVVHIDLGAGGASHGDLMAFEAPFTGENGVVGVINGITFTIDVPDGKDRLFDRFGNILLNFGEGSSLVVGGGAVYSLGAGEMEPDTPQVRAIIGGTGRFIGARGQITTIRCSAGHYEHRIELLD